MATTYYSDLYTSGALNDLGKPKSAMDGGVHCESAEYDFATVGDGTELETIDNVIVLLPLPNGARVLGIGLDAPDLEAGGPTLNLGLTLVAGVPHTSIYDDSAGASGAGANIFRAAIAGLFLPVHGDPVKVGADNASLLDHLQLCAYMTAAGTTGATTGVLKVACFFDRP